MLFLPGAELAGHGVARRARLFSPTPLLAPSPLRLGELLRAMLTAPLIGALA